jgi:hypothetical protein
MNTLRTRMAEARPPRHDSSAQQTSINFVGAKETRHSLCPLRLSFVL